MKHWIVCMQPSFNGSSLLLTEEQPGSDNKFISLFTECIWGASDIYISLAMFRHTIAATSDSLGHVRNSAGLLQQRPDHPSYWFQPFHCCCRAALRDRLQVPFPHWVQDLHSWIWVWACVRNGHHWTWWSALCKYTWSGFQVCWNKSEFLWWMKIHSPSWVKLTFL